MSRADFAARLALGTAQLGLAYGINNTAGRPDDAAVDEILRAAAAAGLSLLDTAAAYGDSEARLGQWLAAWPTADFQLVTKVAAGAPAAVTAQVRESLAQLGRPGVYGLLFHSFGALQATPAAWEALRAARAAGQARRIGVSLYHPAEAEWLLNSNLDFDLVQVPYNVLDQRFGPLLPELARRGVEVHVRSAFLQGLLLRAPSHLPPFFAPLTDKLTRLRALATAAAVPLPALLLLFAAGAPGVARAVVGVDSAANLRENLAAADFAATAEALRPELHALAEPASDLILPYAWPTRR